MAGNEKSVDSGSDEAIAELWTALEEYERFLAALESGRSGASGSSGVSATQPSEAVSDPLGATPVTPAAQPGDRASNGHGPYSAPAAEHDQPEDADTAPIPAQPRGPVLLDAEIDLPVVFDPRSDQAADLVDPLAFPGASEPASPSSSAGPVAEAPRRPAPTAESPGWRPVPAAESPGWRPAPRPRAHTVADTTPEARPDVSVGDEAGAQVQRRPEVQETAPASVSRHRDAAAAPASVSLHRDAAAAPMTSSDDVGIAARDRADAPDDAQPRQRTGISMGIWGARSVERGPSRPFLRELPVLLLIALVLAFLLRTFVVQVFYIPSSSMEQTLNINDRMVVEKITYRFRAPRHGEVVVFAGEEFGQPSADAGTVDRVARGVGQFLGVVPASARDYVKRVIGTAGDEIVIDDGTVFVNGVRLDEPYVVFGDADNFGPVTVPDGQLFFLGDNRPNSSDSRRSLGFVSEDDVVGRAAVVIWPPGSAGMLTGVRHDVAVGPDVDAGAR